ncbi:MAG TPA: FmdB family zinc ribbon protein [Acidimicrobiales bacterium]|nr:FmdB family zinc ribbon protein [Acidimicrobiales bacterium]
MPTYEYACKKCGDHLEVVQSFKDDPLTTCPKCGGDLRKVFGSIGVTFKGSGFYKTDSRPRPKDGGSDSKSSESKSDSKSSDSKSSDSKSSDSKSSSGSSGSSGSKSSGSSGSGSSGAKAAAS